MKQDWSRKADLHYAYQHGVDAVRGDTKAEAEFNQKFAGDAEAEAEYRRGVADESAKQTQQSHAVR